MEKTKILLLLGIALLLQHLPVSAQLADRRANKDALALYDVLEQNYKVQPLICSMAQPVWDYQMATDVHSLTGQWTAMHCFDLMHLCYSPSNWIDYSDITPVSNWHKQGGLVTLMWHWQVPRQQGSSDYTSTGSETTFDPANIDTEGSWEHQVFYDDLCEAATILKQLQDAGIAVLWRPLHEAAGDAPNGGEPWFWWGKAGATVFKNLWQRTFDYLQSQDLHNLIWVWTSCDEDDDWYPGDSYVDIIGTDIYNKDLLEVKARYDYLAAQYPNRMVALTECGQVPYLSIQWQQGCKWSWVMSWYGNDAKGTPWTADRWWKDAVKQYTPTAIQTVTAAPADRNTPIMFYTLDGRPSTSSQSGLHIVRMTDGTVRKTIR